MSYALNSNPATASIVASECAKQYDECAREYDEKYKATLGWDPAEYFIPVLQKAPNLKKDHTILDVGCGTGSLVKGLRDQGFTGRIEGFDISPEMVKICQERNIFQKGFEHDMYNDLPYQDGEFDVLMTT